VGLPAARPAGGGPAGGRRGLALEAILEGREQRAQRLFQPVALGLREPGQQPLLLLLQLVQRPLDPLVSRGGQLAASERANVEFFRKAEPGREAALAALLGQAAQSSSSPRR
jgi:hypothetical protein